MALIYFLSSQSNLPSPHNAGLDFIFKKLAHIFVYAVLYILYYRAINEKRKQKEWLLPLVLTIAYAISDEIHQTFVASRTPTLRDVGFDTLGAVVAMLKIHKRR